MTQLVAGSAASLAANVAVAEPTATGRVIAACPSFGLIAAYELLMRQVRCAAEAVPDQVRRRSNAALHQLVAGRSPGIGGWPRGSGRRTTNPSRACLPRAGTSGTSTAVKSGGAGGH